MILSFGLRCRYCVRELFVQGKTIPDTLLSLRIGCITCRRSIVVPIPSLRGYGDIKCEEGSDKFSVSVWRDK